MNPAIKDAKPVMPDFLDPASSIRLDSGRSALRLSTGFRRNDNHRHVLLPN